MTVNDKTEAHKYDNEWNDDWCNDRIHQTHQKIKLQLGQSLIQSQGPRGSCFQSVAVSLAKQCILNMVFHQRRESKDLPSRTGPPIHHDVRDEERRLLRVREEGGVEIKHTLKLTRM